MADSMFDLQGEGFNPLLTEDENGVRKAVGSPYINGSFSGADIKVVAHLPVNPTALALETEKLKAQEAEVVQLIRQTQYYHNKALASEGTTPFNNVQATLDRINDLAQRRILIQNRLTELTKLGKAGQRGALTKTLTSLQTLSWSIHRDKAPLRFLGSVYARGYVKGPRTIAGTMIFTMFNDHALRELLDWGLSPYSTGHVEADHDYYRDTTMLIDQLPPIDLTVMFANEYGSISYMNLWGVEFQSEGATHSIEDLFSESVVNYVARDIDPIRHDLQRETDAYTNSLTGKVKPKTASQMRAEDLDAFNTGTVKRRNPYI